MASHASAIALPAIVLLALTGSARAADPSFDFMLEQGSGSISVPQGFAGIVVVHATLRGGAPANVALGTTGLPEGVSVAFSNDTIMFDREGALSPYTSTVTASVLTSATTPIGEHAITITGAHDSMTRTTTFLLKVMPVPGANVFHVATWGDDGNPGSEAAPFRTIQRGADAAVAGDTVVVEPGEYRERVAVRSSGTAGSRVTFLGKPGAVIDGNRHIAGWQPAPEIADGVWKKPMSEMPFTPGAMAYQGKYTLWIWWDDIVSCGCGLPWDLLRLPQGHPHLEGAGAYGFADVNHGLDDGMPKGPDNSTQTAYVRLRSGASPDVEDVTFASTEPTFAIAAHSYITIRGFTIRNGFSQVQIDGGAGNVIEHNYVRGGTFSISIYHATATVVRNNDATLNHYVGDMPTADKNSLGLRLLIDLRHWSRYHKHGLVAMGHAADTKIYGNHLYGSLAGILGNDNAAPMEIAGNYIHHTNDYAMALYADMAGTLSVHDNVFYEVGLEAWRNDVTWNDAVIYVYRNRFYNLTHVCEPDGYHGGVCSDNEMEIGGSNATQYWYHNSFNGARAISISGYYAQSSEGGLPNTWIVNNIISSRKPFTYDIYETWFGLGPKWHFDYNWIGEQDPGDVLANWLVLVAGYSHNLPHDDVAMWDSVNPSFIPAAGAIGAGIDLSQPWEMDGVVHPALPGMTPGQFPGAPDLGWFHVASPTPDDCGQVPDAQLEEPADNESDSSASGGCAIGDASAGWALVMLVLGSVLRRRRALARARA